MKRRDAIRGVYYLGAVADLIAAAAMALPVTGGALFGVEARSFGPEYRFAMFVGAGLMLGWSLLLGWGARRPIRRRTILLLTAMPAMPAIIAATVYAYRAALIQPPRVAAVLAFESVILLLFAGAWLLAQRDSRSSSVDPAWEKTDALFERALLRSDDILERALEHSTRQGLPEIQVSPLQGSLLHLLALTVGARRILEIGALGGYSTIWLARALPDNGRLVSLELDEVHAETARANLRHAGLDGKAEVRVGAALDTLPPLENDDPFDLVFIDADKERMPDYYTWARRLTRPGGLIVCDNVVRGGRVAQEHYQDPSSVGVRRLLEIIESDGEVIATAIQTVGSKGYDGFALIRVR